MQRVRCIFVSVFSRKMSRYFPNTLPDFNPNEENQQKINHENLKTRIESIIEEIEENFKPTNENGKDGLYLGTAGVSYMFYHLQSLPLFADSKETYIKKAFDYLEPALHDTNQSLHNTSEIPSFLLGHCGIYALAAVLHDSVGNKQQKEEYSNLYLKAASICKKPNFLNFGSDELFVGRTGYILGALWMSSIIGVSVPIEELHDLCRITIESGRNYAKRHRSTPPLMYSYYNVEYLGAAHGLSIILQVIMSVPDYLDQNPDDARDVKTSVDYLLSLQDSEGNFPCATDEIGKKNELVHWCHGAGGLCYLMAKAYTLWKEEKYLISLEKMGELVWAKGLLKKGPGICHGVAGNGYVFLLLYKLTQNEKHLHRAGQFAEFMEDEDFKSQARVPDCPFSLYEGLAGTACFLADLTEPNGKLFPFFMI